jgi:hypothetical protein
VLVGKFAGRAARFQVGPDHDYFGDSGICCALQHLGKVGSKLPTVYMCMAVYQHRNFLLWLAGDVQRKVLDIEGSDVMTR